MRCVEKGFFVRIERTPLAYTGSFDEGKSSLIRFDPELSDKY